MFDVKTLHLVLLWFRIVFMLQVYKNKTFYKCVLKTTSIDNRLQVLCIKQFQIMGEVFIEKNKTAGKI